MNRGLGIGVLFSGESGTGKTMAAEVIANDLRLSLYRIDLSGVVSKYIGETEKNLRRLFDAAEDGGAILFFDEADSLFGKAQRGEGQPRPICQHRDQLPAAAHGVLPRPGHSGHQHEERSGPGLRAQASVSSWTFRTLDPRSAGAIWKKVFPPETKTNGLDYDRLARLNMTGGSIHNIALNAAFLAAAAGTPVTMQFVLDAARMEFRKQNRPIIEADFRL